MNFTYVHTKCLGIVTLKVLPTSCFRYNSDSDSDSDSKKKAKQKRYEFPSASSIVKCLEDFEKITGF